MHHVFFLNSNFIYLLFKLFYDKAVKIGRIIFFSYVFCYIIHFMNKKKVFLTTIQKIILIIQINVYLIFIKLILSKRSSFFYILPTDQVSKICFTKSRNYLNLFKYCISTLAFVCMLQV